MSASLRALASLATLATLVAALGAAPAALAAGPTREVVDLSDLDADESAWATDWCGFPVVADVEGHWMFLTFPDGRRMLQINSYHTRATYTNPANGLAARLRDVGPDRIYEQDGRLYVAVTGRSLTGLGTIGMVIIDVESGEVVREAGQAPGNFNDTFCSLID